MEDRQQLKIYANPYKVEEGKYYYTSSSTSEVARCDSVYTDNYIYDTEHLKSLTLGERYIFVLRTEPLSYEYKLYLSDSMSESWCGAIWSLDGESENYLETEKFGPVRDLMEIIDADRHTFDMVYTEDMRSIKRFAEDKMIIIEGRALTPEDSVSGANVCVISRQFAEAYTLGVGETIEMKLGSELFAQLKGLGALAVVRERYTPAEEEVTLEIVGIFMDTGSSIEQSFASHKNYSCNTVFVPKSLLPVDESELPDHTFSPSEFSFKVDNPWDIPAFIEETIPMLEQMGFIIFFDDGGWTEIANAFTEAKVLSVIKIAIMAIVVAVTTGFAVYLYIGRGKKQYAVMRALGTTRGLSARSLVLPLMAVTTGAALVGSGAGWIYMSGAIVKNKTLAATTDYSANTAIPTWIAVAGALAVILVTLVIALVMLRRIGTTPPLALLHDNGRRLARSRRRMKPTRKNARVDAPTSESLASIRPDMFSGISVSPVRADKRGRFGFALRYISRHIRRSMGRAALAVALAALILAAVGQFALMKQSYVQLIENTIVTAAFHEGPKFADMIKLQKKDFAKDLYYVGNRTVDLNNIMTGVIITNDIARYVDEDVDITFANGYDESSLTAYSEIIFLGATQMAAYGIELGDTVSITIEGRLQNTVNAYIKIHRMDNPDDERTNEEITALYLDEIMEDMSLWTREYTVAGVVTNESGAADGKAFAPGVNDILSPLGSIKFIRLEITLADNWRAEDLRNYGEAVASRANAQFVMHTEKLDSLINTFALLEILYPIAIAAALIIGGFLCCLVILQGSKEAAILRILGTTKRKTRAILSLEQIFLNFIGLAVGALGLLIYKGAALADILNQLLLFAGLYFAVIVIAAVVCSTLATRQNVLELLQTKE